jgi:hypothetical protein
MNKEIEIKEEKAFKLSLKDFDERGNINMSGYVDYRGGEIYAQPPHGWVRKGLNVAGLFDGGNDHWLSMDQVSSWPVVYHGIKNSEKITKVIKGNY